MSKKIIFLFATVVLLSTCKKYPDGPLLSLRSKEHRVVGSWTTDYFEVDGYDSTAYLKSQPFYGSYSFGEDHGYTPARYSASNDIYTLGGRWSFQNNKTEINITLDPFTGSPAGNLGPYRATSSRWTIRRLKEKELWLESFYNGRKYFIKFSQ
jgi:hypothetical protein